MHSADVTFENCVDQRQPSAKLRAIRVVKKKHDVAQSC